MEIKFNNLTLSLKKIQFYFLQLIYKFNNFIVENVNKKYIY